MNLGRRKSPVQKVAEARALVEGAGLSDNPDALYLLLAEVRSLNGRFAYMLGTLSIITALLLAHVLIGRF